MEEKHIELIDYLNVIWKRKWIIIFGTAFSIIVAGVISFLLKPVYEIDAIIQPGKFLVQSQMGQIEEVVVEEPQQLADKIEHKSYDVVVATELGLDLKEMPRIRGESIPNTLLARMWIKNHDVELSKKILYELIKLIKKDIDQKISIEIHNINTKINENEIQKERSKEEIGILKNKLKIIDQREKDIIKEMDSTQNRIEELKKEQMRALRKENRSEIESLGMLLYSNEVQQSLQYYDFLDEKLTNLKIMRSGVISGIKEEETKISQLDNVIKNWEEMKGRIDYTKVEKNPTSSVNPVAPKTLLNILISAVLSVIAFTILAFFVEYVQERKPYLKKT